MLRDEERKLDEGKGMLGEEIRTPDDEKQKVDGEKQMTDDEIQKLAHEFQILASPNMGHVVSLAQEIEANVLTQTPTTEVKALRKPLKVAIQIVGSGM